MLGASLEGKTDHHGLGPPPCFPTVFTLGHVHIVALQPAGKRLFQLLFFQRSTFPSGRLRYYRVLHVPRGRQVPKTSICAEDYKSSPPAFI